MKCQPECLPCILRQVVNTGRRAGASQEQLRRMLLKTAEMMSRASPERRRAAPESNGFDMNQSPAHNSTLALRLIPEVTGCTDPYLAEKKEYNQKALMLRPRLEAAMAASKDPLLTSALIAVTGNVIDLGIAGGEGIDIEASLREVMREGFAVNDIERLRAALATPKRVVYLADNSGEIVFDRELVKVMIEMGHTVVVAVHGGPILNDALLDDARETGMHEVAEVVSTGSDWVGIELDTCSDEFRALFKSAEVVIAKGHGNYETGGEALVMPADTYFLLKAKCWQVAKSLGISLGQVALLRKNEKVYGDNSVV